MSKITFLLTQDLESPSGLGRYWPMARYLAVLGHQVKIGALHSNFNSLTKFTDYRCNVSIHYIAQMHVLKKGSTKIYFNLWDLARIVTRATLKLILFALSDNADIIFIGKPHPMNGIAGIAAKFIKKSKIFLDCDDYERNINHFQNPLQKWIVNCFEKTLPHFADLIITNTVFTQQRLISTGISPEKIVLIPNGLEEERFIKPSDEELEQLRMELGIQKEWKIIGFVGTLGLTSHPINLLIDAFVQVHQAIPCTKLLLVGGGEDIDSLVRIAKELNLHNDIIFTGRIPPDHIVKYYSLMDVSVDPVYDNWAAKGRSPLKMFESWACEIPFVTGDVGDRHLLSGEPPSSLIVKPGDSRELAKGILAILTEPGLSTKLKEAGKKRLREYLWKNLIYNHRHIFEVIR